VDADGGGGAPATRSGTTPLAQPVQPVPPVPATRAPPASHRPARRVLAHPAAPRPTAAARARGGARRPRAGAARGAARPPTPDAPASSPGAVVPRPEARRRVPIRPGAAAPVSHRVAVAPVPMRPDGPLAGTRRRAAAGLAPTAGAHPAPAGATIPIPTCGAIHAADRRIRCGGMADALDVDAMIQRFRDRAHAVRNRALPPVAGEERMRFIRQAEVDFQDFAIIGDADASLEDGVLVLRVDLRPGGETGSAPPG